MDDAAVRYRPAGPTITRFHQSRAFVRGLMGPVGSSKSTACVMEILGRSQHQKPNRNGVRRTRWGIIRNSYPELKTTTIKTWEQWAPISFGRFIQDSPIVHHVKNGQIDMEVLFLALDREEDQRKLLSLELTGAWLNEAREIPKAVLDTLTGRVGRFPSVAEGGCTWSGVIMDTNPPDNESWWYKLSEEETPEGWEFFKQPAGDSPDAENLQNLPAGYYDRIRAGKDEDWIKVYVRGEYGFVQEGKPVYPMFRDRIHVAPEPLAAVPSLPLLIGVDFGLTPAAVIAQRLADGRWLVLDELVTEECGIQRFGETLAAYMARTFPNHGLRHCQGWGDPAGNQRAQTDERTALAVLREHSGIDFRAAPSNDSTMRLEAVRQGLNRLVDGNPGLFISPRCSVLRKGFAGGYHYRPLRTGTGLQYHESPAKNEYSHVHDALQYLLLGGGEHNVVMRRAVRDRREMPRQAEEYNPFDGVMGARSMTEHMVNNKYDPHGW